jgi:hypothetical protein
VQYRGTSTWYSFDQAGWVTNSPYYVSATSNYQYTTLGP